VNLKPTIVQNRPEVEKQYDAMMPMFQQQARQRVNELIDALAAVYARNFTVDELNVIAAFYATPAGQKLTEMTPTLGPQSMQAITQFQRAVADDIKKQMSEHTNCRPSPIWDAANEIRTPLPAAVVRRANAELFHLGCSERRYGCCYIELEKIVRPNAGRRS
jgi:hypothetical protein